MNIAAIDIGSNSIHMILARIDEGGAYQIIDRQKDMVKLGASAFQSRRLAPDAFANGIAALRRCRRIIDAHGVDHVLAVATSAVRDADNGLEFLDAVSRQAGINPRMISGTDEAGLIHLAVRDVIDLSTRKGLVIDIGGGSVEILLAGERGAFIAESLRLGVQRLRHAAGESDPLSRDGRRQVTQLIQQQAAAVLQRARQLGIDLVIGTSGTILDLGEAVLRRREHIWSHSPDGTVIDREELRELANQLVEMDADERGRVPSVDARRVDTIHLGALLLVQLLDLAKAESIVLCESSIREGLIVEFLSRAAGKAADEPLHADLRSHSVQALLRRCGQTGPHAERVAALSLQMFDQTQSVHQFGPNERRVLEHAAWLHDIGRLIDFDHHERHAYYLIRHGELRGISDLEVEMIALVARYHRKGVPKPRHAEYSELPPRAKRIVRTLAGILRIAEGLDRGHRQVVSYVRCEITPERMRIRVFASGDADLELWAARRKAALLAAVLDRNVEIDLGDSSVEPASAT
ncbi:MAG: Ppx/GppA family phosphatase [Phycisphaerales bacterium]|nr:Ppx/GppA family phosphatase [Phycisphaerales bacterium]